MLHNVLRKIFDGQDENCKNIPISMGIQALMFMLTNFFSLSFNLEVS